MICAYPIHHPSGVPQILCRLLPLEGDGGRDVPDVMGHDEVRAGLKGQLNEWFVVRVGQDGPPS
jgi:hypothetical protein